MHTGISLFIKIPILSTIIIFKLSHSFDVRDCTYSQRGNFFSSEKSVTHFPLTHKSQWTADVP